MSEFVDRERDPAFLVPPDLRHWIPVDDPAHFVSDPDSRQTAGDGR